MTDAVLQRKNMVESQVRPSDVTDRRITAAMMTLPRERFLPDRLASFAYSDENLNIGPGQVMLSPRVLAKLVQLAEIEEGDNVLVIGGGYAAAVIARLAESVVALLSDADAAAAVTKACALLAIGNVTAVAGVPSSGWPAKAPYDVILVEGGVEAVPKAIDEQLRDGGRLAAVGVERGIGLGRAFVLHKLAGGTARRDDFQAAAPLLPGFEAAHPAFVF
jgi:protein-L-isoaspartate(D-aspartate) O-methyltransferase